jgi:hypothetical protein
MSKIADLIDRAIEDDLDRRSSEFIDNRQAALDRALRNTTPYESGTPWGNKTIDSDKKELAELLDEIFGNALNKN